MSTPHEPEEPGLLTERPPRADGALPEESPDPSWRIPRPDAPVPPGRDGTRELRRDLTRPLRRELASTLPNSQAGRRA